MTLGLPASALDVAVSPAHAAAAPAAAGALERSEDRGAATGLDAAPSPSPLPSATKTRPRSSHLTHEQKRLLCIYAKQHPTVTQTQLAQWARERFGLPTPPSQSSISHTLKRKHNFEHMKSDELACKRTRSVKFPELDTALANWYLDCLARQIKVQGDEVKTKAHLFFEMMGIHTTAPPQFSNGWLHSFQSRHGFSRSSSTNTLSADLPVLTTRGELAVALHGVAPWDIYWMDETRLLYCMSPERAGSESAVSPPPTTTTTTSSKVMTLALCTNADGSDLLEPFFVCTHALENTAGATLGFQYAHNKRAWLSPTVFREWLLALDWKMHEENRTVVLLLDTYASHYTKKLALKNLSIRFVAAAAAPLSASASSITAPTLLAPVEREIMTAFKRRYRHAFLDHVLDRRDERAADIFSVEPLQAIEWVIRCWRDLPRALVAESFAQIGVPVELEPASDVAQSELRLDAQILALVKRLKLKAPMALDNFLSPAAEHVQDEALTSQDFVDSAVNAALGVRVVGTEVESPRRLIRGRSKKLVAPSATSAGSTASGAADRPQQQSQLLSNRASSSAIAVESVLSSLPPAADTSTTTTPTTSTLADAEWQAWTQSQRTKAASDFQALQRVIRLATEMNCEASTVLELNRMLLEVTQTQALALPEPPPPPKDDALQSTAVCRFTFGVTSTKHVV